MSEIWKDIKGYEGIYQISDCGRVRSIHFGPKNHGLSSEPRIMRTPRSSSGYLHVQLYKDHKPTTKLVHILVAEAFVDNPHGKPEINHIDGNKSNNTSSNLEWVTKSENLKHAARTGLRINPNKGKFGADNHVSVPVLQYDLDGNFIRKWDSQTEAANCLGIHSVNISHCACGRIKMSRNFIWVNYDGGDIPLKIEPYKRNYRFYNLTSRPSSGSSA